MTTETQHYGLTRLAPGEGVHAGDGKFPSTDRDRIDQILYSNATHKHTGAAYNESAPPAPTLTLFTTGGYMPAGTTISYVVTYTDPTTGETAGSDVASVTTAAPVAEPSAPTATVQTVGGQLPPGKYFYILSAYQGTTTVETKALNPVEVTIPAGSSTNAITLTMPALPAGATGFNVYRRIPNGVSYHFIASTTATSLQDVGADVGEGDNGTHLTTEAGGTFFSFTGTPRTLPAANNTNSTNSVTVQPGGTVPAGNGWTIYRSYSTSFLNSFLTTLPSTTANYIDTGSGTSAGSPPSNAWYAGAPSKIDLTSEVQGALPVVNGGTGATNASDARTNLGLADVVYETDTTTAAMQFVIDEDSMATNTATKVPTQQSVKAYVDSAVATGVAGTPRGYYAIVDHGATASTARPAVGNKPVLWRGTVEPTNALDNYDDWLDYS